MILKKMKNGGIVKSADEMERRKGGQRNELGGNGVQERSVVGP